MAAIGYRLACPETPDTKGLPRSTDPETMPGPDAGTEANALRDAEDRISPLWLERLRAYLAADRDEDIATVMEPLQRLHDGGDVLVSVGSQIGAQALQPQRTDAILGVAQRIGFCPGVGAGHRLGICAPWEPFCVRSFGAGQPVANRSHMRQTAREEMQRSAIMATDLDQAFSRIENLAGQRGLPDVTRSTSYGTPALKVRDKSFVRLKDATTLVL